MVVWRLSVQKLANQNGVPNLWGGEAGGGEEVGRGMGGESHSPGLPCGRFGHYWASGRSTGETGHAIPHGEAGPRAGPGTCSPPYGKKGLAVGVVRSSWHGRAHGTSGGTATAPATT